jgi:DNA-binding IclR family transcriptional regulator
MMFDVSQVPAATRALRILRFLASQPGPVPAERIARAVGMPRSSAYHLLNAMIGEGFVVHVADDQGFGLGLAVFEVGTGFARQEPLQRVARRPLAELSTRIRQSAHLAVMHGRDVLYVIEQRYPGRPTLVTDVGVRLPAHLTASGRAILASLPKNQLRALFPDRASFVNRTGAGPRSLTALHSVLATSRSRGYAVEDGEVSPDLTSVAVAVHDHNRHPIAAVAVTYAGPVDESYLVDRVAATAAELTRRIGG